MQQPVIYVFTHDSIGQGEDGTTHQRVEHLAALRGHAGTDGHPAVRRPMRRGGLAPRPAYPGNNPTALVLTPPETAGA